MRRLSGFFLSLALGPGLLANARAVDFQAYPVLVELVERLVAEHGLERDAVETWLTRAEYRESVIRAITRPAEGLPWHRYRALFVTETAIRNGVEFFRAHRPTLERAMREYGVDPAVIVAIIGIETRFGTVKGNHRVIDSLTTLSVGYPRRSKFFTKELGEYLVMTHRNGLDPLTTKGSYAGAIGIPQFMPSSYRGYSVDFNGDGVRDLVNDFDDAIGSVANYLSRHHWRAGQPVAHALDAGADLDELRTSGLKPDLEVAALEKRGLRIPLAQPDWKVGIVRLESKDGYDYRVGFHNFFVITTYNRSQLYAMAAHELSSEIRKRL